MPITSSSGESLYSTTQIAIALKVSRISFFRYIRKGKLKAVKEGRNYCITKSAYYDFIFRQKYTPALQERIKQLILEMVLSVREEVCKMPREDRLRISRIVSKD